MTRVAKPPFVVALLMAIVASFTASPVAAAGGPEVASLSAGATALVWQPAVAYERMVLTVSGPDGIVTREFDSATLPSLDVFGADGYPLTDGGYKWELRAVPAISDKIRAELARARTTGDSSRLDALRLTGELPEGPMVVSGHFRVLDGAFVQDAEESAGSSGAGAPQVLSDASVTSMSDATVISGDLTVYNSLCVGLDCLAAESYGFDTIRLKENNLRIHFDDTSATGSFPNRDWRLVANDSSNGGRNVFYLEDATAGTQVFSIEAGAGNNALYVDDGGRVGIGTSTPVLDLHVVTGNTPALRLDQDGSSGFTPQIWDVAGNEANFFVRDVTAGSRLPFKIFPGAPTNTLTVHANTGGSVGIGTTAPDASLHVRGTDGDTGIHVEEASATTATRTLLELENNGRVDFRLIDSNSGGEWTFSNAVVGTQMIITRNATGVNELVLDSNTGNLIIQGDFVTPTNVYPDYVLEPDYPLMPLADLRDFIGTNGHLPNVPSEAEARENGLRLADMQVRLLEKIEELTLYTLQQDELIAALQTRLESLEAGAGEDR